MIMSIIKILKQLADNPHHRINLNELLIAQPHEIKETFITHNNNAIKLQLRKKNEILADADEVVLF